MKFANIFTRLKAVEPTPENSIEAENENILAEILQRHFFEQIESLGLSHLAEEFRESLRIIGPRPLSHGRRGDRSAWICIDDVSNNHRELTYRIRAAESLALADTFLETGSSEDSQEVKHLLEYAASDLEREKGEQQTACDLCGADLTDWHCNSFKGDEMVKICGTCSTTRILER